jgi:hypothetical protein
VADCGDILRIHIRERPQEIESQPTTPCRFNSNHRA